MACGKIVLATRVLSVPEVVKDGSTGFLAACASLDEIYKGIVRSLTFPDKASIGVRARKSMVEHFSYPVTRRVLLQAYEALLER
jgi:glycosyltransferase involved in cell wall biosynthesis